MAGLVILLFFAAVAIFAPVLADSSGLDPVVSDGPILAPPSLQYPFGTDDLGRSVLTLTIWGSRISLLVGLMATVVSMLVGSGIGILAGYRGGLLGSGADADHGLVPRHSVARARDHAGRHLRPVPLRDRDGDRPDLLGGDGAARQEPGALRQGAALRRTRAGARCRQLAARAPARPPEPLPRDLREHDPHRRPVHPFGDDAVVPGAWGPASRLLGGDARARVRGRRVDARAHGGGWPRRGSRSCSWCSPSRCAATPWTRSSTRDCDGDERPLRSRSLGDLLH